MNKNPNLILKLLSAKNEFKRNHPKFEAFVRRVLLDGKGITEGTVVEITVTRPGEEPITSNLRIKQSDMELVEAISEAYKV